MNVVDGDGERIGTVENVKMGDPQAVTTQGQGGGSRPGLLSPVAEVFADAEPDVPPAVAARLLRTGFIKVDARGLFARDFYVAPDQVARVDGDTVHLTADAGALARET
ncbi:PRC-barrel domain-containing protein [Nonomuraea sp. SYSU D8015]|uniref:PRC-barrel domain-containing protein n=1 Tax=Nonomuraea sp. SYSU D8015 TaxID=2593644 RepID=UPI001660E7A4|nr:PRC-barrel domain-containing protein [Nonomuraea sp. SYSU D8015]